MTRLSQNQTDENGRLINGYDYKNQAWVLGGCYVSCGHPATKKCNCYGRLHDGEETKADRPEHGKQYSLTGAKNSIANGDSWRESEVK